MYIPNDDSLKRPGARVSIDAPMGTLAGAFTEGHEFTIKDQNGAGQLELVDDDGRGLTDVPSSLVTLINPPPGAGFTGHTWTEERAKGEVQVERLPTGRNHHLTRTELRGPAELVLIEASRRLRADRVTYQYDHMRLQIESIEYRDGGYATVILSKNNYAGD